MVDLLNTSLPLTVIVFVINVNWFIALVARADDVIDGVKTIRRSARAGSAPHTSPT